MNEYRKYYDRITPAASDEELLQAVLSRKADKMKPKTKGRIRTTIIAAAAALAALTTAAAGAANGWDYTAMFSRVFYNEKADTSGSFDFAKYGKEIDEWRYGEDFDVHVIGAAAEAQSVYILFDVVREGDWSDITDVNSTQTIHLYDNTDELFWQSIATWQYSVEGDTIHYMMEYTMDSTAGQTLRPTFEYMTYFDLDEQPQRLLFGNTEPVEIEIDFPICEEKRVVEVNKDFEPYGDGLVFHIDSVEITPFRYRINMTNAGHKLWESKTQSLKKFTDENEATYEMVLEYIEHGVILNDGTRIMRSYDFGLAHGSENEYSSTLPCPVDPYDIAVLIPVHHFEIPLN